MPYNEQTLESLSTPYLWFSHIENFNDPFEAQFEYKFTRDPERIISAEMSSGLSGWHFAEAERKLWEEFKENPDVFYQKREKKFKAWYEQSANKDKYAYCCFFDGQASQLPDRNILMWSHYGNGLRGFRVTYNTEKLLGSLEKEVRAAFIRYSDRPRVIDLVGEYINLTGPRAVRYSADLFLESPTVKSKVWAYESELRVVCMEPGENRFDPSAITRVDLGDRMSASEKRTVCSLIKSMNSQARVYIAKVKPQEFDVYFEPFFGE